MNPGKSPLLPEASEEVAALIATLHQAGERLEELTAGQVDTVAHGSSRPFLLGRAQEQLRLIEAAKQAAILNALPAHIALLDRQGVIVSVNHAWRRFGAPSAMQCPGHRLGVNYLAICESARGENAPEARRVADGIRSVLAGQASEFSIEYSCRSAHEQRWLLMTATSLAGAQPSGVAVMHLDITEQKRAETRIKGLNRVYAVLSGITTLIVRARDRGELFGEACRLAVQTGGFELAWLGVVERGATHIKVVASDGAAQGYLERMPLSLQQADGDQFGLAGEAVRDKKPVIVADLERDPRVLLRAEAGAHGLHSLVVLPLTVSDTVVGVLAVYAREVDFFNQEEMKLLTELAGDIAFAIDHLDKAERLDYLAYYDALTGLANRQFFLERLAQYMRSAAGGGHKLAVFLIDLERFKNINDSLGRPAGDALLKQVAEWLARGVGDASLVARVSADCFAVVLPEVRQDGNVARLLEKSMAAFVQHPFRLDDAVFQVSIKAGVALFPDDAASADALFRNAETALEKAKAGGDRYLFYTQTMTETQAGKLTLENQLRQALDKEEFVLHYQPKVSLADGRLTGAEALIRWNDPRTGLVAPGRFIPMLEETGLINEVGRWALRKTIQDCLRWRAAGLAAVRISVNVSPLQLRNRGFIDELRQAVGVDAHAAAGLELEITESVIMEDVKNTIATLQAIRKLGVTIAIDDFGTGFSSLSYLAKLPVDTLKIDRSFIVDMTEGPEGLALVSTIIALAHSLRLKAVAEGVETAEQSRLLRLLSCDEMQGYLFSQPVPAELFETSFLRAA